MILREVQVGRIFIGKLDRGDDLLEALTRICVDKGVRLGRVEAIGAVECARVGYYDQRSREYRHFELSGELEILSFMGNVSLREGAPFIHAHTVFGDASGAAWGGHLAPGAKVFACEYVIQELLGDDLERSHDESTGLPLWSEG
jgi:predicted DNA-binding protein with PD1-like motif